MNVSLMFVFSDNLLFETGLLVIESLSFTYTANGKRQIQVKNFSK